MARPDRPDFPKYFLGLAREASKRADCTRLQIGAVITQGNRIWATGYNGPPESGQPGCLQGACPRGQLSYDEFPGWRSGNHDYSNCIAVHAEINAIYQFSMIRKAIQGGGSCHIWVTHKPCNGCKDSIDQFALIPHWPGYGLLLGVI